MKKSMLKIFVLAMSLAMSLTACGEKDTPQGNLSDQSDIQYPTKPITIVVPFGAGGTTDIAARILADNLPGYLDNATIVVSNITGGSGTIGTTEVTSSIADGYTLGCSAAATVAIQPLFGQTSYTLDDIKPICNIYTMPQVIVASADAPYNTVDEFVEYIKGQGTVNYAIAGRGTVQHLVCVEWMNQVGITASDLSYSGGSEQATAILSGECEFGALQASDAIRYVEAGQLKILLNLSDFVPSWMSDVPTTVSLGYTSSIGSCVGLWAPADTDDAIIDKLASAIEECLKNEKVIEQFDNIGIETQYLDGDTYGQKLSDTSAAAKELMTSIGLI